MLPGDGKDGDRKSGVDASAGGRAARCGAAGKDLDNDHAAAAARARQSMIGRGVRIGGIAHCRRINLFRRLFLTALADAHAAGRLAFFGNIQHLHRREAFAAHLAPLKRKKWFVYTKPPFAGPQAVLAYLARYTHRVAISNRRLVALDERGVTFRYKD